eukprot:3759747-Amphidinium_carterae.1
MAEVVTEQLSLFEQFYGRPGTIKAKVPEPDDQTVAREELASGNASQQLIRVAIPKASSGIADKAYRRQAIVLWRAALQLQQAVKKVNSHHKALQSYEGSKSLRPNDMRQATVPMEQTPVAPASAHDNLSALSIKELKQRLA